MKRVFLLITCCLLYSSIVFAGSDFPYKYNVKTKTGSGTVYADTKDVFNPTRQTSITNKSGEINLPLISDVTTAYQEFYLDALPAQGYGLKQWRKVDSNGTDIKIIGNTRKSKIKETLGNSESVFYYEADFDETMVSVDSENPNRCQAYISKEINQVGDVVTLTATTNANCNISWKKNGVEVSTDNPLVVNVTEKAHYTASATLMPTSTKLADGYYRIRNAVPDSQYENDYMKVADSWFHMSAIVGSARNVIIDVPGVVGRAQGQLQRDLNVNWNNYISDPGTIVYIKNNSGNEYDIYGQGIHVKELTTGTHHGSNSGDIPYDGCYVTILNNGGVYSLYANIKVTYNNQSIDFGNFYFGDYVGSNGKHEFSMSYADFAPNNKWFIEKVEGNKCFEPNFGNAVLSNNKEYTTLRLPFPSIIPLGSELKAYSVTSYPSVTGDLATLTEYGEGSTIPAGLPVVLEKYNSNVNSILIPSGDISSYDVSSATNSSGENSVSTALYNKYGTHLHDPAGDNQDQPTKGDGVGYFSGAYTGSATLYKLSVNSDGVVGFWTPVANNETIYGNQAYATQPCALFPKEIELVDFPAAQDEITYKLVDPLTVAYVDNENNIIYAKDDNGAAEQAPASGEEDFMALHFGENTYVDHSNWVAIEANSLPDLSPRDSRIEATGKVLESAPNRRMVATRVDEVDEEGFFDYNTYSIVNLMPKSSHSTAHHNFFFAAPQANEIANIIWAQWDASTSTFIVPPTSGFTGVISTVFDLYNDSDNPTSKLQDGHQYQFIGLIKKTSAKDASNLYQLYPLSGITDHDDIITGVHNILTQNEVVSQKYYNTMGIESDVPFRGVNIMVTNYSDGSRKVTKVMR